MLQVVDDRALYPLPDPATNPYGVFPFRYRAGVDGDLRLPGYYDRAEDIDYGLLHEIGHQLGLIDIYRLDIGPDQNEVSHLGYSAPRDLMNGCDHFLSPASALAMQHWLDHVHGYYGQYLYNIPQTMKLRVLDYRGQPLANAHVTMYQVVERPGKGQVITDQPKASGLTDANGYFTLPNVNIDESLVLPVGTEDVLHDNPFGYVAVVGTNGVLHFKVEKDGATDFAWLDITEANVAYWTGHQAEAVFDRQLALGMPVQTQPPEDMAEPAAGAWTAWAVEATASATYDTARKIAGDAAVHFVTDGGGDTYARYPQDFNARWDLSGAASLTISVYAENPQGFQSGSPWIRLVDSDGDAFQYQYYANGSPIDFLNGAIGNWQTYHIPLRAPGPDPAGHSQGWIRTAQETPDITRIHLLEFHSDTWDNSFQLWLDDVRFERGPTALSDQYNVVKSEKLTVSPAAGLLTNDAFVPGVSTSAILVNGPQHGILDLRPDGSFTYQPQAGYVGADHFLYKLSDGQRESVSADVGLAVTVPELANFRLFSDATLTAPGLMGSYVDRSLRDYAPQDDWRQTQTIAGTRIDPQLDFTGLSWGTRADVGLTHGLDSDWEDFSVQWDGYLEVVGEPLSFWTRSDDGSRMWIDINQDGAFDSAGAEFIDNHWGTGQSPTDGTKSPYLPPGVYRIRLQYEEIVGGNTLQLLASLPPLIRVAYVIPSNRTPQPDGVENLQYSLRLFQDWYRNQMDRNGFGPKTLRVESERDGVTPAVHVVHVTPTDEAIRADPWSELYVALADLGVDFFAPGQFWLLVPETQIQLPDGSVQGVVNDASRSMDAGVVMASAAGLAYTSADDLSDNRAYHGQIIPAIGPYPLVQDVSFPWSEGTTISSLSSSWLGATLFSLTRMFDLPYERRNGWDEFNGNLQHQVPHGLRGAVYPALYPNDDTYLGYGQSLALSVSPFFGSLQAGAERQTPEVSVHTAGQVVPVDGLLQISFSASDDTGLAGAVLLVDGGQAEEMPLSGREANAVFATSSYQPGVTNRFQVIVYDIYGNQRRMETVVTPLAGLNSAPHPHIRLLDNTTPRINQNVTLDAGQSWDWDVGDWAMTVEWDLNGDGVFDTAPTQFRRLVTSYDVAGTHLVRARLTDLSGAQSISAPLPIRVINPWHNDGNPFDTTGEGELTANDPLVLINHINAHPNDFFLPPIPVSPPPFLDVNGDGRCTPGDVLAVINKINAGVAAAEGEGLPPGSLRTVELAASMPQAPTDWSEAVRQTLMTGKLSAAANGSARGEVRGGSGASIDDSRYTAPSSGRFDPLDPIARRVRSLRSLQDRDALFSLWGERDDPGLDSEELGFQFW